MDKNAMVRVYNGRLLNHKKECFWVSSNEVDETKGYYTEWSKSEREKQMSYINAYIWYLEKWYWWAYLQGSSGVADVGNSLVDTVGAGEKGTMERAAWKHTLPRVRRPPVGTWCVAHGAHTRLGDHLEGWEQGLSRRRQADTYRRFMVMCGRNQHNFIQQLSSN